MLTNSPHNKRVELKFGPVYVDLYMLTNSPHNLYVAYEQKKKQL